MSLITPELQVESEAGPLVFRLDNQAGYVFDRLQDRLARKRFLRDCATAKAVGQEVPDGYPEPPGVLEFVNDLTAQRDTLQNTDVLRFLYCLTITHRRKAFSTLRFREFIGLIPPIGGPAWAAFFVKILGLIGETFLEAPAGGAEPELASGG